MSVIDNFKTDCTVMTLTSFPDGEGGYTPTWTAGPFVIKIAIVLDNSTEAKIAMKNGVTSIYKLTFDKSLGIKYNDYIKRISDGQIFRVTSIPEEKQTPARMAVQFMRASAERTVLPK